MFTREWNTQQKPNNKDESEDKTLCSEKNSLCIAFLLIPTLGKSGWTLFLIKIRTTSVRTLFYCGFVYRQGTIRSGIFKKISVSHTEVTLEPSSFCWSTQRTTWPTWTCCKICVGKSFGFSLNSQSHGFLLNLQHFRNSSNNSKCDRTLMVYKVKFRV